MISRSILVCAALLTLSCLAGNACADTVQIDSSDSADTLGPNETNYKVFQQGGNYYFGIRFPALPIKSGATIHSATVTFRPNFSNSYSTTVTIYGENVDNASPFSTSGGESRTQTSSQVSWPVSGWSAGDEVVTPDLSSLLQDVTDRTGWAEANSFVVLIQIHNSIGPYVNANDFVNPTPPVLDIDYTPSPELVAHWAFDDGFGTTVTDSVGDNDGTISGTYAWQSRCDNGYLSFPGTDNYVTVPDSADLRIEGDSTISGWFQLDEEFDDTQATSQVVLEKFKNNGSNMHVVLVGADYTQNAVPEGSLVVKLNIQTGAFVYLWTSQNTWDANRWYHFVVIFDADDPRNGRIYINGHYDIGGTSGKNAENDLDFDAPLRFGGRATENTPGHRYLDGSIDDIRIYNYPVSDLEISRLYGLILHWNFDEASGTLADDATTSGFDGTATDVAHTSGRFGQYYGFNGTSTEVINTDVATELNGLSEVTVALWVNVQGIGDDRGIFVSETPDGHDDQLSMRYDSDLLFGSGSSGIKAAVSTTGGHTQTESASGIQSETWRHVAITWKSGDVVRIYNNGELSPAVFDSGPVTGVLNNVDHLRFGIGIKSQRWLGFMDDVRIYNRALCDDEIYDLYSATETPGLRIIRWQEVK